MIRKRIGQISLVLIAALLAASSVWFFHDVLTLVAVLAAAGLVSVGRSRASWVVAVIVVAGGLYWSRLEIDGCSAWWRGSYVVDKALGRLPQVAWKDVTNAAFSNAHCFCPNGKDRWIVEQIKPVEEQEFNGYPLTRYKTHVGDFWLSEHARHTMAWLLWEIHVAEVYQGDDETIRPGDTVIDCGAHVGVYTRYALNKGAGRVIAIEPEPTNIACLKRNFAAEILDGKVTILPVGVWNERSTLELHLHSHDTSRSTFYHPSGGESGSIEVPVVPLDEIVNNLKLERVDFIKMDIEGAERQALQGAERTIRRFRPRMAICSYHRADDPAAVYHAATASEPSYRVHATSMDIGWREVHPKILFFN
jgi:FkbM family methyltransferase